MTTKIQYKNQIVSLEKQESVLEALERSGIDVPSSCRAGICHFCLLKATDGCVTKKSQEGLDKALKETGHFKSCVCYPENSLVCEPAHSAEFRDFVKIQSIEKIGLDIIKVSLSKPKEFRISAGQFATFRLDDGHARSYSIASLGSENYKDFDIHVRKIPNGKMSGWFHSKALSGDKIWMEGPQGECTYKTENPDDHLLLIGTGTGVAPLYAIAMDAIKNNHRGRISVVQGALSEDRLYYVSKFKRFEQLHKYFEYRSCVLKGSTSENVTVGDLRNIALDTFSSAQNLRIYLCGDPSIVKHLKKHFFLAGTSLKKIHADPFVRIDSK